MQILMKVSTVSLVVALLASVVDGATASTTIIKSSAQQESKEQKRGLSIEIEEDGVKFEGSLSDLFEQAYDKVTSTAAPVTAPPVAPTTAATPAPAVASIPVTTAPVTSAPIAATPTLLAPITASPVTPAPVSAAPITPAPVVAAPVTAPATASPIVSTPITTAPATAAPVDGVAPIAAPVTTEAPILVKTTQAPVPESGSGSLISCNRQFESVDAITYRFAMEVEADYDIEQVLVELEDDLNKHIAARLLACAPGGSRRILQEEIGLVAIDSRSPDTMASTAFCASTFDTNTCKVVDGQMRIFLGRGEDTDFANYKVRLAIRDYLNSINAIPGLYATTYLSPEIISPAEASKGISGSDPSFEATAETSALSKRSITLFAFAGAAFIGSVGIAVWFRRSHERRSNSGSGHTGEDDGGIKNPPPNIPRINTTDTGSWDAEDQLSPFSAMLPAAYRLDNGEDDMSVILELNERGSSLGRGSSILLSEGGYSTDEGESLDVDLSALNFSYNSQAPTLGAVKRRTDAHTLVDV